MGSKSSNFGWFLIYFLVTYASLHIILALTIFIISKLEQRFNCVCVCRGYRNRYICIPLYCIYRNIRNNTIIVPQKNIEFYSSEDEYCNKTGHIIVIYPNNKKYIGVESTSHII